MKKGKPMDIDSIKDDEEKVQFVLHYKGIVHYKEHSFILLVSSAFITLFLQDKILYVVSQSSLKYTTQLCLVNLNNLAT